MVGWARCIISLFRVAPPALCLHQQLVDLLVDEQAILEKQEDFGRELMLGAAGSVGRDDAGLLIDARLRRKLPCGRKNPFSHLLVKPILDKGLAVDGSAELLQLAHLLRAGAEVAQDIGTLRPHDRLAIKKLAAQAIEMAEAIEQMVRASELPS